MKYRQLKFSSVGFAIMFAIIFGGCQETPVDKLVAEDDPPIVDVLNGAWVSGVQTGISKVYITELRFNNGLFEWTWDGDLQQRGVYDTNDGILTVTTQNNYGSPQRYLGDYSRPYTVVENMLNWGGSKYTKK